MQKETWDLVEQPRGKQVIRSKWVFKVKCGSDGKMEQFKAALVAKGYTKKHWID